MTKNYSKTIKLLNLIQFIGWLNTAGAVLWFLWAWSSIDFLFGLTIGLPAFLVGLLIMAIGQVGAVLLDVAETNSAILAQLKRNSPSD